MQTLAEVTQHIKQLASDIAAPLGYNEYRDEPVVGFPASIASYANPTYVGSNGRQLNPVTSATAYPRMVLYPRRLSIYHPDFVVFVNIDSSYTQWSIFTRGDVSSVDPIIRTLAMQPSSAWSAVLPAWERDMEKRKLWTARQPWGMSTKSGSTKWSADQENQMPPSSVDQSLRKTPQFGDLLSRAKPSRRRGGV